VATICLGCSYAYPVLCSLIRGRRDVRNAPFSLGKFGYLIVSLPRLIVVPVIDIQNGITVVWISFSIILFCMRKPPLIQRGFIDLSATAIPVTPTSMNYASVVFAGFSSIAILWYAVYARKHYKGPIQSAVGAREGSPIPQETVEVTHDKHL